MEAMTMAAPLAAVPQQAKEPQEKAEAADAEKEVMAAVPHHPHPMAAAVAAVALPEAELQLFRRLEESRRGARTWSTLACVCTHHGHAPKSDIHLQASLAVSALWMRW